MGLQATCFVQPKRNCRSIKCLLQDKKAGTADWFDRESNLYTKLSVNARAWLFTDAKVVNNAAA